MENVPDIPEREHVPDMMEQAPEKEACNLPDMEHVVDPAGATFNMLFLLSTSLFAHKITRLCINIGYIVIIISREYIWDHAAFVIVTEVCEAG